MKRDPALVALSQDHHQALVLARRAGRAATDPTPGRAARILEEVRQAFTTELERHFVLEEEWLLPALAAAGEDARVLRTLDEHAALRRCVYGTSDGPEASLCELSRRLMDHVHFEEHELFAVAQARLDRATLEAIASASRRHR